MDAKPLSHHPGAPPRRRPAFAEVLLAASLAGMPAAGIAAAQGLPRAKPALVVVVVVDQLRGDLPETLRESLDPYGGFAKLTDQGATYENARYEHAVTSTAPGHATLFTGAHPAEHGIVGNVWFDRGTSTPQSAARAVWPIQDTQTVSSLLSRFASDVSSFIAEGRRPRVVGPHNLRSPTVGDALLRTCRACKVFAVSPKDRGAVFAAGRRGRALWFNTKSGTFGSGPYYGPSPGWVEAWNLSQRDTYPDAWELLLRRTAYQRGQLDDRPLERPPEPMGRVFPHPLGERGSQSFFENLKHTPHIDRVTLDFAMRLIHEEGLGLDDAPDLLAVSLSATDYVGHAYGPGSLEAEDNLIRLDRNLADFIEYLDRSIGRDRFVLAVTADHGVSESVEAQSHGLRLPAAGVVQWLNENLSGQLSAEGPLVANLSPPWLYLDHAALRREGITPQTAAEKTAELLRRHAHVADAVPAYNVGGDTLLEQLVANSNYPDRAGDVFIVTEPHAVIVTGPLYTAFHGSPRDTERHVALAWLGGEIPAQRVSRPVSPRSLAPTLASILGVSLPNHAQAPVLREVL